MENQNKISLLDTLLDKSNTEPIVMMDESGKTIEFEQVAVIPHEENLYCILYPVTKLPGIEDDEAIAFRVTEEETLVVEEDESTAIAVFDKYYELLGETKRRNKK